MKVFSDTLGFKTLNSHVPFLKKLHQKEIKQKTKPKKWVLTAAMISQYKHVSSHYVVHLKLI